MKQIFSMDVERDIDSAVEFSKYLNKKGWQGEFYICGHLVEKYPEKVKQIAKYHILGGHGYYHEDFARLNHLKIRALINKTMEIFKNNGLKIRGWRFPGLSYSNYAMNYVATKGLYDSSIRDKVWNKWGNLFFIRNWGRNLLRGIVTVPYLFSNKLVEKPWSFADLNYPNFICKNGRLMTHCYNYKQFEKYLK